MKSDAANLYAQTHFHIKIEGFVNFIATSLEHEFFFAFSDFAWIKIRLSPAIWIYLKRRREGLRDYIWIFTPFWTFFDFWLPHALIEIIRVGITKKNYSENW